MLLDCPADDRSPNSSLRVESPDGFHGRRSLSFLNIIDPPLRIPGHFGHRVRDDIGQSVRDDIGPAIRDYYLVHFVKHGKGIYHFKQSSITVSENELFLIPPNEVTIYQADSHNPWEYYWFGLSGNSAKHLLSIVGLNKENRKIKYRLGHVFAIDRIIYELTNITQENESDTLFELSKLYEIFSYLKKNYDTQHNRQNTKPTENNYVKTAIDYMNRNYMQRTSIAFIADYVGIDRTILFRYFKKDTGISPKEYLIRLRMQKAVALLETTDLSIKEITFSVGYQDPYLFSKMFKKRHSISPRQYRQNQSESIN